VSNSPVFNLLLEINKLKSVFRTNISQPGRQESTAEHTWSMTMIAQVVMPQLQAEFPKLSPYRTLRMCLVHDLVEIYAGDVNKFDEAGREAIKRAERQAMKKLAAIYPDFGQEMSELWHEFEKNQSIEAQVANAVDLLCPMFLRVHTDHSYEGIGLTKQQLIDKKKHLVTFSTTLSKLFTQLIAELDRTGLFARQSLRE